MDFSILNSIGALKKQVEKNRASGFDARSFLNNADRLTKQVDIYFKEEPCELLSSMDKFDKSNDFAIFEMEICAAEIMRKI